MKSKALLLCVLGLATVLACKLRKNSSGVKEEAEGLSPFDVNDVTILFDKVLKEDNGVNLNNGTTDANASRSIVTQHLENSAFYPHIDIRSVWPQTAFSDLINFAKGVNQPDGVKFGQFRVSKEYAASVVSFRKTLNAAARAASVRISDPAQKATAANAAILTEADSLPLQGPNDSLAKQIAIGLETNGSPPCDAPLSDGSILCIDASAQINFNNHRSAIENLFNWRIVSMRMDLCAGAHDGSSKQCDIEFRLIAQPFGDFAPIPPPPGAPNAPNSSRPALVPLTTKRGEQGNHMFDVSAHLLFKIGTLDLATGSITKDGKPVLKADGSRLEPLDIVKDLATVKAASPISTDGQPLGVHPGLRAELNDNLAAAKDVASRVYLFNEDGLSKHPELKLANAIAALIKKYTVGPKNNSLMTNVTSMHLSGAAVFDSSVWTFFQGEVTNSNGRTAWTPTPITGNTNLWSIRTASVQGAGGKMFPPPQLLNSNLSIDPIFDYESAPGSPAMPPNVADLPSFFDNPGRYGDPALAVNNRVAASVGNTDCVSCHMTATRSFEWNIRSIKSDGKIKPSLYIPPVGTTAYLHPEVVPRLDYNLRNLGYFLAPPIVNPTAIGLAIFDFTGTRKDVPAIMTRVVDESAELVNLINSRFIGKPNPGLTCDSERPDVAFEGLQNSGVFSEEAQGALRRNAKVHAKISDCLLFDSFKPNGSFAACVNPVCTTNLQAPVVAAPNSNSGNVFTPGIFIPERRANNFFASSYEIDNVVLAGTVVTSLRLANKNITFKCTNGICTPTDGSDRKLTFNGTDVNSINYTSEGTTVTMNRQGTSQQAAPAEANFNGGKFIPQSNPRDSEGQLVFASVYTISDVRPANVPVSKVVSFTVSKVGNNGPATFSFSCQNGSCQDGNREIFLNDGILIDYITGSNQTKMKLSN